MIANIHKIALVTDDIEGAVRFYTGTLGLTELERFPNEDDEDFVFLKAGDVILELMPRKSIGCGRRRSPHIVQGWQCRPQRRRAQGSGRGHCRRALRRGGDRHPPELLQRPE